MNVIFIFMLAANVLSRNITYSSEFPGTNKNNEDGEKGDDFSNIRNDIKLKLYTSIDTDKPYLLETNTISDAPTNNTLSTTVIIPGWKSGPNDPWLQSIKDVYFKKGPQNIIIVDWSEYTTSLYMSAKTKAKQTGQYVGKLLVHLCDAKKLDLGKVHIIGHCLGAHLAGFAGKQVKLELQQNVARITGLDPSQLLYEMPLYVVKPANRLDKTDAKFVDVIHTATGPIGIKTAIGHADFYPNGGLNQPGCLSMNRGLCSHIRSIEFYLESLNSKNFISTKCKSWFKYKRGNCDENGKVSMGYYADTSAKGTYYLQTNKRPPYAKG